MPTLEELVSQPDGSACRACDARWTERGTGTGCPQCGSSDIADSFPEIPSLDEEPLLAVVLAVEAHIPRTEGGAILFREMLAWLRFHGVRERSEVLTWESFFREIGAIRSQLIEELTALPPRKGEGGEEQEE